MAQKYQVVHSTGESLSKYRYVLEDKPPEVGDKIFLINNITEKRKAFEVQYVEKVKGGYILKNRNNTIFLRPYE